MDSAKGDTSLLDEDWEFVPRLEQSEYLGDDSQALSVTETTETERSSPSRYERLISIRSTCGITEEEKTSPCRASSEEKESLGTTACQQQRRSLCMNPLRPNSYDDSALFGFLEAIRAKNESLASLLLATGIDPNSADVWGPAITQALRAGLEKLTRALLMRGADPDATDIWGPVLTQAIRAGDTDLARQLLQRGACPDAEDVWGSALTQAIRGRNEQLAMMLVKHGADPEARDTWGSALAQSARHDLRALTTVLLDAVAISRGNRDP